MIRIHRTLRRTLIGAASVAALSVPASAQSSIPLGDPSTVASVNPFIILFGYFSGEVERRVSPTLAFAGAGSWVELDDEHYANVDFKARMYPNERALQGFGLAAGIGVTSLRDREFRYDQCTEFNCVPVELKRTFTKPSFSLEVTYQWLLGRRKSTAITVGGGARRILSSREGWGDNIRILPTGKLNVGYAF